MAFDNLSSKLQDVFKQLRGKGTLTEKDVKSAMREVKLALLEADVNFKVVKDFVKTVTDKAIGDEVFHSLTPGQHVVKIVNEEMINLLGNTNSRLTYSSKGKTVYMMVGLQGAGKTTASAKIAAKLKKEGKKPLLVACDVYRPAAVKQLQVLGKNYDIPVFAIEGSTEPVKIANEAMDYALKNMIDVVILDTAGRLHIDESLMGELQEIKSNTKPTEILLVLDSMTGQDSVTVAESFDNQLGVDGIIMTKLDGDTRGGAALSVRAVTGKPIKFIGMGEKVEDLEEFYPDRLASRILGMGDVLTLIDKAQVAFDEKEAAEMEKKFKNQEFDFEDFLQQMKTIKKMGSIKDIMGMIPGMSAQIKDADIDEKQLVYIEAIITSMTRDERKNPDMINGSRKKRIASGSGRTVQEVNRLLKQFKEMKVMMKKMNNMSKGKKGMMGLPFM